MTGDILARLQAAQSDAEREWVLMEWSLANLEPEVRAAVWAAAIPHWFDAAFLAALLDKPLAEAPTCTSARETRCSIACGATTASATWR